jgi:hypothetical protein
MWAIGRPLLSLPEAGDATPSRRRGRGSRGDVALYRFVATLDTVFVLAIQSHREAMYQRDH